MFSFVAVLLLSSSLVMLLFQGAQAVEMEFTTTHSTVTIGSSQTFAMKIVVPQNTRVPITRVDAIVEEERSSGLGKVNPVVITRTGCNMTGTISCSGSGLFVVQGASGVVTSIRVVSFTNPSGTTITGYVGDCPCTGYSPGYGYDTVSPDVNRGGYGYGYKVGRSDFNFATGRGYGYSDSDLIINFEVTITGTSAMATGSHWLTVTALTGSTITGELSTPFTAFTVQSASSGGGGGGGGAASTTITVNCTSGSCSSSTFNAVAGGTQAFVFNNLPNLGSITLSLNFLRAITNGVVNVQVSTTPIGGAVAVPSSFGSLLYLDISVTGASGAVSGGSLTFTVTPAQLGTNSVNQVTMLHFVNNVWQAEPTTCTAAGSCTATLGGFSPFAIAFDTAPPTITNLRPPEGAGTTTRPLVAASLVDNRGISTTATRMSVDGQPVQATVTANEILYTPPVALTLGTHTVRVDVTDLSGFTANRTWTFNAAAAADAEPPTVTPVSPPRDGFTNNNRPVIEASFADNLGVDTTQVTVTIDGAPAVGPTISATGVRVTPAVGLTDGRHTVTVTVSDTSGNSNFASWSFTVDTALPVISAVEPEEGSTVGSRPTLQVTCSDALAGIDGGKTRLTLDGVAVGSGGSYTPTSDLKEGSHTATASCTDMAGNTATRTWSFHTTPTPGAFPTMLVLVLILLVVVAGAGYWWYTNKGPGKKP